MLLFNNKVSINKCLTIKRTLLFIPSVLMALSSPVNAEQYADMHKQLAIMSNIIKSSTKYDTSKKMPKISQVETTYLKGQGVVFTIKTSSSFFNLSRFNFSMPHMPQAPQAPDVSGRFDGDLGEIVEDAMDVASESWEIAVESMSEQREAYRELRDQQRELSSQSRDIEREIRDLDYQNRHSDKESDKAIAKQKKSLVEQKAKLEKSRKKLAKKTADLKTKQKIEKEKKTLAQQQYYRSLSQLIGETFCSYGNTLKALPNNEKISVILKGAAQSKQRNTVNDKIYVFKKQDVINCAIDKINVDKLMASSQPYEF